MLRPILKKIFITIAILSLIWVFLTSTPLSFTQGTVVTIAKGDSVKIISQKLKQKNIIQSEVFFTNSVIFLNLDNKIVAGDYIFKTTHNMFEVLQRISRGDYDIEVKRVTLIEGLTIKEMSQLFAREFYNISEQDFMEKALQYEGYLFPDTYYFAENTSAEDIIFKMRTTFDERVAEEDILTSEKSLKDIVIMASIIEKEATSESMQEVSNILWHRMDIDMPLQVDAGFVYERNKHTFELSLEDLQVDSPYNTYVRRGLTPTPISNPGVQALRAAAFPESTKNLYFLTGTDGEMYYAQTLKEHEANKEKYFTQEE